MEWLLIVLIVLAMLLNIRAIIVLVRNRQVRKELDEDTVLMHQKIEEFVSEIEKENEELYHKLVDYIKVKESKLEKRIGLLEHQVLTERKILQNKPEIEKPIAGEKMEHVHTFGESETDQDKISKLHKQGFTPKQIAKVLKMEFGEVEFIVNLLNRKKSY